MFYSSVVLVDIWPRVIAAADLTGALLGCGFVCSQRGRERESRPDRFSSTPQREAGSWLSPHRTLDGKLGALIF